MNHLLLITDPYLKLCRSMDNRFFNIIWALRVESNMCDLRYYLFHWSDYYFVVAKVYIFQQLSLIWTLLQFQIESVGGGGGGGSKRRRPGEERWRGGEPDQLPVEPAGQLPGIAAAPFPHFPPFDKVNKSVRAVRRVWIQVWSWGHEHMYIGALLFRF